MDDYLGLGDFVGDLEWGDWYDAGGQYPDVPLSYDTNWTPGGRDWYSMEGDGGVLQGGGMLNQDPWGDVGGGWRDAAAPSPGISMGGTPGYNEMPTYPSRMGPSYTPPQYTPPAPGGGRPSFGGAPGPRGGAAAPLSRIQLGAPPSDLYNLYSKYLKDPSGFAQDPAFQFLYNQGMQSLNRTLAAKRLSLSGKAMSDAQEYGQNFASQWLSKMLPEYRAGAGLEFERYMGPSSLLPRYAAQNNQATQMEGSSQAAQDLIPRFSDAYERMLSSPGGGGYTALPSPVGWGGQGSGYVPPRLADSYSPSPAPVNAGGWDPVVAEDPEFWMEQF